MITERATVVPPERICTSLSSLWCFTARSERSVSRCEFLSELVPSDEITSFVMSRHVSPRSSVCRMVPASPTAHAVLSCSAS